MVYLLPGAVAGVGALVGLLSGDEVRLPVLVLTLVLVGLGFVVPPVVDRLRDRQQRVSAVVGRQVVQLHNHFEPRARGVLPTHLRKGSYFTGRRAVLADLIAWCGDPLADPRGRLVTGDPGSGKSAVLGRLLELDRRSSAVAVHARGRTADEVGDEIAVGLRLDPVGATGLLAALRSVRRRRVLIVDAVDEAIQPYQLIQDLLEPLAAGAAATGLRCVFGSRRGGEGGLLRAFGDSVVIRDLDSDEYLDHSDVAAYVRRTLLAEADRDVRTPYRDRPDLVGLVADAVASRAGSNFLVAQLTALALMAAPESVDIGDPATISSFPAGVGAAMDRYLREVEPEYEVARDLLTALAWAEGDGLTDFATWAAVATALGTAAYTEQDVVRLLRTPAVDLVAQSANGDRIATRMFHEALAEHLRAETLRLRSENEIQRRIAGVLIGRVSVGENGERLWSGDDEYTRRHLCTHAARGACLDELLADAGFLVVADAAPLLLALPAARTTEGHRRARLIERVGQQLLLAGPEERVSYLEMAARMAGDDALAERVGRLDPDRPWRSRWARWVDLDDSQVLGHHDGYVLAVHIVDSRAGAVIVAASEWAVRAWWLRDGTRVTTGISYPHDEIQRMVAFREGEDVVVLTAHRDGEVRRATLFSATVPRTIMRQQPKSGLWTLRHHDRQILLQTSDDRLSAYDADSGEPLSWPPVDVSGRLVTTVASVDGRPLVVLGFADEGARSVRLRREDLAVEVRDLATGALVGQPLRPAAAVPGWHPTAGIWSAAIASVSGRLTVLVGGSIGGQIFHWEPEYGIPAGEEGYSNHAGAMSTALLGESGKVMAVGDSVGDIHVWEAPDSGWRRLAVHDNGIDAVAIARVGTRNVLVTGGRDGTVRLVHQNRTPDSSPTRRYQHIRHMPRSLDVPALTVFQEGADRYVVVDASSGDVLAEHALAPDPPVSDIAIIPGEHPSLVTLHRSNDLLTIGPALAPGQRRKVAIPRGDWWAVEVDPVMPQTVVLCGVDGALAFFDLVTGVEVRPRIQCHTGAFWIAIDPVRPANTTRFVTATTIPTPEVVRWTLTDDGTVERTDLVLDEAPDDAEWPYGISEFAYGWHADRRVLVGAGSNSHVQVWDADDGGVLWSGDLAGGHNMAINAVEVANIRGETYILTGGHTCTLGFLELATGQERHLWVGSHIWSIAADSNGNVVIGGVRGIMGIHHQQPDN
ncbi:WD40 repeat domain-containing protein [Phytohabitans sp. LJ34]|uniref:WD40 repeat domain-containing protein n=1 Tax=Phytohabitans sp. LJ34 TaxID=3452217 RepID=UPI003F8C2ED9